MKTLRRYQTTVSHGHGVLSLVGSEQVTHRSHSCNKVTCVPSPYFQMTDSREEAPGQEYKIIPLTMIKCFYLNYANYGLTGSLSFLLADSTGVNTGCNSVALTMTATDTAATIAAQLPGLVNASCITNGIPTPDTFEWLFQGQPTKAFSNPTRALNTAYQPSTTRDTMVIMSVEIDASLSLTGGTKGTVSLVASPTSSFTTPVTDAVTVDGNTGTLTVGLNTVSAAGGTVVGIVPAGYYYKAVPASSTGTATFTVLGTQEIQL